MNHNNRSQIDQALSDGFVFLFSFVEDAILCEATGKQFPIFACIKDTPRICFIDSIILYRVITPCGKKGYIALDIDHQSIFEY